MSFSVSCWSSSLLWSFLILDVWCLNHVCGNPGGEGRHTRFEAVSLRWGGASISCQKDKKNRFLIFELTFKYLESSNNHNIPGVKLLIPTTVQIGAVPGAAVLMTTGPPTSAYYTFACYKWSQIFWISKWKMNNSVLYTDKLLREIHYFYLLNMWIHWYQ